MNTHASMNRVCRSRSFASFWHIFAQLVRRQLFFSFPDNLFVRRSCWLHCRFAVGCLHPQFDGNRRTLWVAAGYYNMQWSHFQRQTLELVGLWNQSTRRILYFKAYVWSDLISFLEGDGETGSNRMRLIILERSLLARCSIYPSLSKFHE